MADGEIYSEVYISCNETNHDIPVKLYQELRNKGLTCSIGEKDFLPGRTRLNNARSAVTNSRVIVTHVTEEFHECDLSLYESALGLDLNKHVVLIKTEKSKIHDLLRSCIIIDVRDRSFDVWLGDFLKIIKRLLKDKGKNIQSSIHHSLLKRFLWTVEDRLYGKVEYAFKEGTNNLLSEINKLKIENKILMKVRFDEISDLAQKVDEQQEEIKSYKEQLKKCNDDRSVLLTELQIHQTYLLKCEKLAQRHINDRLQLQKIQNSIDILTLHFENNTSESLLKELSSRIEELTKCHTTTRNSLDMLVTAIYNLKSNVHDQDQGKDECRIPADVIAFCQEYENMIGPNVLKLCRHLELTCEQMKEVENRSEYGFCEMFWVAIREWVSKCKHSESGVSVRNLLCVLEQIGIPVKGKPMSTQHLRCLQKNILYLQNNVLSIVLILSELLEQEVVNATGISYVLSEKTRDTQILRLVDVLSITDRGFSAFNTALVNSGQKFISEKLIGSVEDHIELGGKIPSENDESSSEEKSIIEVSRHLSYDSDHKADHSDISDSTGPSEKPLATVKPIPHITVTAAYQDSECCEESPKKVKSGKRRKFHSLNCLRIK